MNNFRQIDRDTRYLLPAHPAMLLGLVAYGYATGLLFQPQDRAGNL